MSGSFNKYTTEASLLNIYFILVQLSISLKIIKNLKLIFFIFIFSFFGKSLIERAESSSKVVELFWDYFSFNKQHKTEPWLWSTQLFLSKRAEPAETKLIDVNNSKDQLQLFYIHSVPSQAGNFCRWLLNWISECPRKNALCLLPIACIVFFFKCMLKKFPRDNPCGRFSCRVALLMILGVMQVTLLEASY